MKKNSSIFKKNYYKKDLTRKIVICLTIFYFRYTRQTNRGLCLPCIPTNEENLNIMFNLKIYSYTYFIQSHI